jgi:hypothetical protein
VFGPIVNASIQCFLVYVKLTTDVAKATHTIITTILLKLNEIIIGDYLQQTEKHQA